ncbi:hypothetical protein K6119_12625 [Paracrocinitomix mangrovi]|uniref:hypothetical protein n=1 Tax=Paracrocinitomix mangrovi TaxID=2862509 RepID=UPI001C8ED6A2|nr:hypothetical protein [Paracrocinitomix mangrovi]UKN00575.1 hypothetical protein K6119_12625 [Paracrocinitomix mangrovi]
MKNLLFLPLLFSLFLLGSCKKDDSAVKMIDGHWDIDKMVAYIDGDTLDLIQGGIDGNMTFYKCKFKNGRYCSATKDLVQNEEHTTVFHDFKVSDEDTHIWNLYTEDDEGNKIFNGYWEIEEVEARYLKVTEYFDDFKMEMEFSKVSF